MGVYETGFWEYLLDALNMKGPTDSLERVDIAIGLARKLKEAKAEKAETLTVENDEFKVLDAAMKAYLSTRLPEVAREVRVFYRALEPKSEKNPGGVQDVELAIKK
jgi:hypothetical protein